MRHRLKRWYSVSQLWPICFCILFGHDVARIDTEMPLELYNLLEAFGSSKVVYPDVLPIISTMLQQGLKTILRDQDDPDSPLSGRSSGRNYGDLMLSANFSRRPSTNSEADLSGEANI